MKKIWKQRNKISHNSDQDLKYIINNDKEGYLNNIIVSLDKIFLNAKN